MPHVLNASETGAGVYGQLDVVKKGGTQNIQFYIKGATLRQLEDAWKRQGNNWDVLWKSPSEHTGFRAVRVIVAEKWQLTWNVNHCNDTPYDSIAIIPL